MQPYIASPVPKDLAEHMDDVLERIRSAENPSAHRDEGIDLILRLTEASLDYYFLRSITVLGLGKMAQKVTKVGLKTSLGGISMFVRRVGKSMNDEQILALTDMVEGLILEVPDDSEEE